MSDLIGSLGSLSPQQLLALSVFSSYFLLILWLFSRVLESISLTSSKNKDPSRRASKISLFWGLTIGSFAHTWFYMFQYMAWSFANYEAKEAISPTSTILQRVANWLVNTSLFEEAWYTVCLGKINWAWSEQLCLFTVGAWTVFLYIEGSRHQITHVWAYMILGQVVAISVASNLFYVALLSSTRPKRSDKDKSTDADIAVPAKLWLPILISILTIATSPFTTETTFLPNLLVMHALLIVPLLSISPLKHTKSWFKLSIFYLLIFLISIPIRSRTMLAAAGSLPETDASALALVQEQWKVLHSHPAQSSIGWDVVWSSLSFIVWSALTPSASRSKLFTIPYLILATPFASIGLTAPYVLRPRHADTEVSEKGD
ncbi:hypothetical protein D9611_012885 [Ephemerocybe angulata]|uniref:Uncharacterized protein n=1 Tax=Ephemerocybe angulata TaxID=980116 RepID=A0A8H5F130_9AGAR|nr:hypothetical protein D9611_012885 [Tulosesus angulatus]